MVRFLSFFLVISWSLAGCGTSDNHSDAGSQDDAGATDAMPNQDASGIDGGLTPQSWTLGAHPCLGPRTDALFCDSELSCFVGCGTDVSGDVGAKKTEDGGQTWSLVSSLGGVLDTMRVNDISRSSDGLLYLAGAVPGEDFGAASLDSSGTMRVEWTRGNTVETSFTAGSFRRNSSGFAFIESLTGSAIVYRNTDNSTWSSASGFWDDGDADDVAGGVQLLQIDEHDGEFYGSGSTIGQSPMVFLGELGAQPDFAIVQLADGASGFDGLLWDLDVTAEGIVAGGVNLDADVGIVFTHANDGSTDVRDPATWQRFDVSTVLTAETSWVQGVCRGVGVMYAVGHADLEPWGFALKSTDGGTSFSDVTPYDLSGVSTLESLDACQVVGTSLVVAGANGQFGVLREL